MNIAAILDNLVYLGIGICFIYVSIKQKDKLGKKFMIARLGGIASFAIGIIGLILVLIKK